ncbi:MAG: copper-binding protein [Pirellulales bacterium]|nr:copper-binding protein [Pirellulales bacterium]
MRSAIYGGLFTVAFLLGCQGKSQPAAKQYDVTGKVTAVDAATQVIRLDHDDIPGLMQAMEMDFKVDQPQLLKGIGEGDRVKGRMEVRSGDYIFTNLSKQ